MTIDSFMGDYRWLSNYELCTVTIDGKEYRSNEHYYQACKATTEAEHEFVRLAPTPGQAKKRGQTVTCRPDWETVKESVMLRGLRAKFAVGTLLATRLLATRYKTLIEGNTWGDRVWGVCRGMGQNRLGKLLMLVRQELVMKS